MGNQLNATEILSDITVFTKYAKYIPELNRRETWRELVTRNKEMHLKRYPALHNTIEHAYKFVYEKKVLPSMRSLQFGGRPIEVAPNRIFNCAYMPIEAVDSFAETMFLLLGGTGVGYSVQSRHVSQLPVVLGTDGEQRRYLVGDSIEGWADAVKVLVESHFYGKHKVIFDYSDIREKGALLVTSGGKAPGAAPLQSCLDRLDTMLVAAAGRKLTTLEVHDMQCHIADAVLAGGIRRAAMICLFDRYDEAMLTCKAGNWWVDNAQRSRANNSAVLPRNEVTLKQFNELWQAVIDSGSGEPGVYWTNDTDWGTNPCCEIALRPYQFCNLTEINASDVVDQTDLNERANAAAIIGTLQAGYTDFHYLRPIWKETTEKDALIGVGMTGIGSGAVLELCLKEAAHFVVETNRAVARLMGINQAARTTTVKPAGTSSMTLGSSSGIHAWHNDYYIRRMRVKKNESIYGYLNSNHHELVVDEHFDPTGTACIEIPQAAPEGAILRTETPLDLLERVRRFNVEWVRSGHHDGANTHNVSVTVSVKPNEFESVGQWMWDNRDTYNGISVLPYDGGTYIQAPFEDITEKEFQKRSASLTSIDLTQVLEEQDETDLSGEIACGADGCEIV